MGLIGHVTTRLNFIGRSYALPGDKQKVPSFTRPFLAFCVRRGWPARLYIDSVERNMETYLKENTIYGEGRA